MTILDSNSVASSSPTIPQGRLITLKKSEVDFERYLIGNFSDSEIAIPIQSLNVGKDDETITFNVVSEKQIARPNYFLFWAYLIKLKSYIYILAPLFFVVAKNFVDDRIVDPNSLIFTVIGSLLLYASFNIRNDFNDHMSGWDRVFPSKAPKPISRGWIKAGEASYLAWFLFAVGCAICIPSFIMQKELVRVAAVIAVIFFGARLFQRNSFKTKEVGEVALFLLSGPGLASAYQVALGGGVDTEILAFGVLWGFGILFLVHLNNFAHLMDSEKFGLENAMIKYGFDRSQKFLVLWWIGFIVLWSVYHIFYSSTYMTWFTSGLLAFWSIPTLIRLAEIQSPVGSDLFEAKHKGEINFLLMVFLLVIENIWYVLMKLGWITI